MSQLSSTLKRYTESARYTDAPFTKPSYGTYTPSSYGTNLAASLPGEGAGFQAQPPPAISPVPYLWPPSILDYDRAAPC